MAGFEFTAWGEDDESRLLELRMYASTLILEQEVALPRRRQEIIRELGHVTFELKMTRREMNMSHEEIADRVVSE